MPLAQVPFRLDDDSFFTFGPKGAFGAQDAISLPTCLACPRRSGNDPELLAAIGDANVCTDKACHDVKAKEAFARRKREVEASGKEVLSGEAAAAITPTQYGTRGFVDLDEACHDDEFPEQEPEDFNSPEYEAWDERYAKWQPRTYRQLLGDAVAELEITLVQDPKNKARLRELAPDKAVAKLLKEKAGIKARIQRDNTKPEKPPKPQDPEAARRAEEKAARERAAAELEQRIDAEYHARLFQQVFDAWKGPLKSDELELIADHLLDDWTFENTVGRFFKKRPAPSTMSERDLGRLIVVGIVALHLEQDGAERGVLALAKRLKIDPAKVKKEVKAELTPKDDAAPAKKPAAKKAKKK